MRKHKIEITFNGDVNTISFKLEGMPTTLVLTDSGWKWKSQSFGITDTLDFTLEVFAPSGTGWKLAVTIDGNSKEFEGKTKKNYSNFSESITI